MVALRTPLYSTSRQLQRQPQQQPLAENPFALASFAQTWWMTLARKFQLIPTPGQWVKHVLKKGPFSLTTLRLPGWNAAWQQTFSPKTLKPYLNQPGWDVARIIVDTPDPALRLNQIKAPAIALADGPEFWIDLSQGWEAYLKTLSKPTRRDIKKKLNHAETLAPELRFIQSSQELDTFLDRFFQLHISYWEGKTGSYLTDPIEQAFIRMWLHDLFADKQILVSELFFNNESVNLRVDLCLGQKQYGFLTINTGAHQDAAPGIVMLHKQLQWAAQNGIKLYSLGPGTYRYKQQSKSYTTPRTELLIANPRSLRGRLFLAFKHWKVGRAKSNAEE